MRCFSAVADHGKPKASRFAKQPFDFWLRSIVTRQSSTLMQQQFLRSMGTTNFEALPKEQRQQR
jgi:hypothetical protein